MEFVSRRLDISLAKGHVCCLRCIFILSIKMLDISKGSEQWNSAYCSTLNDYDANAAETLGKNSVVLLALSGIEKSFRSHTILLVFH